MKSVKLIGDKQKLIEIGDRIIKKSGSLEPLFLH